MESTEPSAPWFDVETCRTNAPRNSTSPNESLKHASRSDDCSDHFLYSQFLVDDDESDLDALLSNPTSNPQVSVGGSPLFDESILPSNSYDLQTFLHSTPAHGLQYSPPSSSSNPPKTTLPSYEAKHTAPLASEISAPGTIHSITEEWTQLETSSHEYQTNDDLDWENIDVDRLLASYFYEFPQ